MRAVVRPPSTPPGTSAYPSNGTSLLQRSTSRLALEGAMMSRRWHSCGRETLVTEVVALFMVKDTAQGDTKRNAKEME